MNNIKSFTKLKALGGGRSYALSPIEFIPIDVRLIPLVSNATHDLIGMLNSYGRGGVPEGGFE